MEKENVSTTISVYPGTCTYCVGDFSSAALSHGLKWSRKSASTHIMAANLMTEWLVPIFSSLGGCRCSAKVAPPIIYRRWIYANAQPDQAAWQNPIKN